MPTWAESQQWVVDARSRREEALGRYYTEVAQRICTTFRFVGHVLEIGCGSTWLRRYLPAGCVYWGIDPIVLPGVACQALGEALPFKDKVFDTTVCYSVLQHVLFPALLLAEASRVTKTWLNIMVCVNQPNPMFLHRWSESEAYSSLRPYFGASVTAYSVDAKYRVMVGPPCA